MPTSALQVKSEGGVARRPKAADPQEVSDLRDRLGGRAITQDLSSEDLVQSPSWLIAATSRWTSWRSQRSLTTTVVGWDINPSIPLLTIPEFTGPWNISTHSTRVSASIKATKPSQLQTKVSTKHSPLS